MTPPPPPLHLLMALALLLLLAAALVIVLDDRGDDWRGDDPDSGPPLPPQHEPEVQIALQRTADA